MDSDPQTVTDLLWQVRDGDDAAFDRLFPLVYDELHRLARGQRRRWQGNETLNTTGLLHEAYLKLAAADEPDWESRAHFYAVASKAMRQILMDYARATRREKRGGDRTRVPLDELRLEAARPEFDEERVAALVKLDESLDRLQQVNERQSRIVECRFFGGMTIRDTAAALLVSPAAVKRGWGMAKAWVDRDMDEAHDG